MRCKENPAVTDQIDTKQNEKIIFSILTNKKNRWGIHQSRTICVTNLYIYLFGSSKKKANIHRKIEFKHIQALSFGKDC